MSKKKNNTGSWEIIEKIKKIKLKNDHERWEMVTEYWK